MAIYDVNAAIDKPNLFAALQQGTQFGNQQRALREQRADQQALRELTPGVMAGDPDAYAQAVAIDPQAAGQIDDAATAQARKLKNWYDYTDRALQASRKSGDFTAVNAALRAGAPYVSRALLGGKPAPTAWTPDMDAGWQELGAKVAMMDAGGAPVQSTRIGADGFYWTVDRQGNWTNSGIKADPNVQLRDQPGLPPGIVDLRGGTISPLREAGAPPPGPAPTPSPTVQVNVEGLPQEQAAQLSAGVAALRSANVPEPLIEQFVNTTLSQERTAAPPTPAAGLSAPRPAIAPAEQRRLDLAADADRRAEEANARAATAAANAARGNAPTGFRFKADGSGTLEPIPGAPTDAGKPLPQGTVDKLTKDAGKLENLSGLSGGFKDDFAGNKLGGSLENLAGRLGGASVGVATPGQAEWWQQYDRYKNEVRNELFGASLTSGEQAAFEAADITPNMDPPVIRQNLKKQADVIRGALQRKANTWAAQGYNREAIQAATGLTLTGAAPNGVGGSGGGSRATPPRRAVNPQTGEVLVLVNGQWVPE